MTGLSPDTTDTHIFRNFRAQRKGENAQLKTLGKAFIDQNYTVEAYGKIYHASSFLCKNKRHCRNTRPYSKGFLELEEKCLPQYGDVCTFTDGRGFNWFEDNENSQQVCRNGAQAEYNPGRGNKKRATFWSFPRTLSDHSRDDCVENQVSSRLQTITGPFVLFAGHFLPHTPWTAPEDIYERYSGLPDDHWDIPTDTGFKASSCSQTSNIDVKPSKSTSAAELNAYYHASVEYIDEYVGATLDALKRSPHADNTWVVLWSDHGYHLGDNKMWAKKTVFERSSHIPFAILPPQHKNLKQPQTVDHLINSLDIYPTFAELFGLSLPENYSLEGRSFAPLLSSSSPTPIRKYTHGSYLAYGRKCAKNYYGYWIRKEGTNMRYVVFLPKKRLTAKKQSSMILHEEQLYDVPPMGVEGPNLVKDPQHAEILEEFRNFTRFNYFNSKWEGEFY
jgi:arylsulfatase A-like enzyme